MSNTANGEQSGGYKDRCRMEIWMAIFLFALGLGAGILAFRQ